MMDAPRTACLSAGLELISRTMIGSIPKSVSVITKAEIAVTNAKSPNSVGPRYRTIMASVTKRTAMSIHLAIVPNAEFLATR